MVELFVEMPVSRYVKGKKTYTKVTTVLLFAFALVIGLKAPCFSMGVEPQQEHCHKAPDSVSSMGSCCDKADLTKAVSHLVACPMVICEWVALPSNESSVGPERISWESIRPPPKEAASTKPLISRAPPIR